MCKVSVLVPIYNSKKYLRESLDSLQNQTFGGIEAICLDDGSADGSGEIAEKYAKSDGRFRVVRKANSGYGDTMNLGVSLAKGEYIAILEPDDFMEKNAVEMLYNTAKKFDADVVKGNYYAYDTASRTDTLNDHLGILPYGKALCREPDAFLIPPAIWAGLYRRSFLDENEISFLPTPGASFQDTGFAYKTIYCAKRFVAIEEPIVHYRSDNAASSVNDSSKWRCIVDEMREVERFLADRTDRDERTWAVFARVKKLRYQWNYDRLDGENKERFGRIFKSEMEKHYRDGWVQRWIWNDVEWGMLMELIGVEV